MKKSQNVRVTKCKHHIIQVLTYCDVLMFCYVYVLEVLRFETLIFRNYYG